MKNLSRTLSLFLIFSGNFYKSKTRNIVTELCYKWCTTQTNDKVLIEQTKNNNVQGKSIAWCSFSFECSLQDTLWLLYVHFKSSSSNWFLVRNSRYLYTNSLGLFYCGDNVHKMCTLSTKCVQRPQNLYNVHKTCTTSTTNDFWFVLSNSILRHFTESHVALHMIDFNCMQCFYDISRAYIFLF